MKRNSANAANVHCAVALYSPRDVAHIRLAPAEHDGGGGQLLVIGLELRVHRVFPALRPVPRPTRWTS